MTQDYDRLAEELDKLEGTGRELEGFVPVKNKPHRGPPRTTVSIRMSTAELTEILDAAGVLRLNASEFIRDAALRQARQVQAGVEAARAAHSNTQRGDCNER